MKRWLLGLLMLTVAPAWALKEVRLLNQSSSGQSALFNMGTLDGVAEGDYAVIVKQIRDLNSRDLRIVPVARARNVKMTTDSSVWVLFKIFDRDLLKKGDRFLILSESEMLRGRRDPRLGKVTAVGAYGRASETAGNALRDDRGRIVKLKDKYREGRQLKDQKPVTDNDATLVDVESWGRRGNERYRTALYKGPNTKEFNRELRLATFEKLVTGYLKKVNDPDFSYDAFYAEQMRTENSNEFRKESNFETEYRSYQRAEAQRLTDTDRLRMEMLTKGESWSEDYSDEELAQNLKNISILQEKGRREYLLANPDRYSIFFDYGINVTDSQTTKDTYRRDSRLSLEGGFEFTPFLKHESLERFTLFGSVRRNQTALASGGYNADVNDLALTVGANWYPLYASYVREAPVFFIGTFLRTGQANMKAPTSSDEANYTMLSVPGFWGGMKYLLRSGLGLRIHASVETLMMDRYESSREGSVLPDSTKLAEAKMGFGLMYSF